MLPEYAVDFVFTCEGRAPNPDKYAPLALANMTGGNRLLIGVGWSLVVLLAAWRMKTHRRGASGYTGPIDDEVKLDRGHSVEIAFLLVATVYSLTLPLKRTLTLFDSVVLIGLFVAYLVRGSPAPRPRSRISSARRELDRRAADRHAPARGRAACSCSRPA